MTYETRIDKIAKHSLEQVEKEPDEEEIENATKQELLNKRKAHLQILQGALLYYAYKNNDQFPKTVEDSKFPNDYWTLPDNYELKYQYFPGLKPLKDKQQESVIVVAELNLYDDDPLVLKNDGTILQISQKEWNELQKKGEGK